MDELKEIREALSFYANLVSWSPDDWGVLAVVQPPAYGDPTAIADRGLAALSRLETREAKSSDDSPRVKYLANKERERKTLEAIGSKSAREAEAPKDARELDAQSYEIGFKDGRDSLGRFIAETLMARGFKAPSPPYTDIIWFTARALESRIAAAPKTVPMAMLHEICDYGLGSEGISEISREIKMHEIAETYEYKAVK